MTTPEVTSFQVRAELEDRLERDLLGPWDGPEEELPPRTSPAERYMLGRLVPRDRPAEPEESDDGEAVDAEETDPGLVDREVTSATDGEEEGAEADATVRSGSMSASAIGLAFSVAATVDAISVTASWGRYERSPSQTHETPQGRAAITWHRVPAGGAVAVRTDAEGTGEVVPDDEQPGVVVRWTVRHRGARRVVELSLVNGQRAPGKTPDVARLYQVGLTVTAPTVTALNGTTPTVTTLDGATPDGATPTVTTPTVTTLNGAALNGMTLDGAVLDGAALDAAVLAEPPAIFLGHNDPSVAPPPSAFDDERLHLELLHRGARQYAHGRQCAVDAFRARGRAAGVEAGHDVLPLGGSAAGRARPGAGACA